MITDGNVFYLPERPERPQTCFECDHLGIAWGGSSWCLLYDEGIDSEIYAAKDCPGFEPICD